MHIHVCLVSEQPIPNILSILHHKPDGVFLISTEEMEKRRMVENIVETLSLKNFDTSRVFEPVIVKEDSITDCKMKIEERLRDFEDATFSVNITGGTKVMAISAFEVLKDYAATVGYIPRGKNDYIIVFPKKKINTSEKIDIRLSVTEYLTAYGLKVENVQKLSEKRNTALARKELTSFIMKNYSELIPLLEKISQQLREHRHNKKGYNYEITPNNPFERRMLELAQFEEKGSAFIKHLSREEIEYLTGGWLEEYCFNELMPLEGLLIDDMVIGITISKGTIRNEFDVMFTSENALFTIECKSLSSQHDPEVDILYKISALQKNFGLRVGSFLVTTSPHVLGNDGQIKAHIKSRADDYKTEIIIKDDVPRIREIIESKIKGVS